MNENFTVTITPAMLAVIPVVAAILQVLKNIPAVVKLTPYLPFAGIIISMGFCFLSNIPNPAMSGVLIGLVAGGGYDLVKGLTPAKT